MRVNNVRQLLRCALQFQCDHRLGNQFGGSRADDVYPKDFAVLGIGHNLDESIVLAHDAGARVGGEREFADFDLIALFFGLGFRQPHATDLRMAVGGVGNAQDVDWLGRFARDVGNGDDAFHRTGVGQLRIAHHDVADGVNPRLGGPHVLVNFDEAALDFDLGLFDADVLGARGAANSDQHLVGFQRLLLAVNSEGHGHSIFRALDGFDLGVHEAVDTALAVDAHQFLGNLFVLHRHVTRQHLEDGHLRAE